MHRVALSTRRYSRLGGLVLSMLAVASALLLAAPGAARAQPAPPPEDAAMLRELAERLLIPPYPGPPGVDLPPARLLAGAIPADLPLELPFPPGARLIGSVVRPSLSGGPAGPMVGEGVEVVLDTPDAPSAVIAFYDRALRAQGLFPPIFSPGRRPGGFLPTAGGGMPTFYCQSAGGPFVEIVAVARRDRPTDLRLRLQDFPGPCSVPPGPPPVQGPPPDPLPPLEAPAGVSILPSGSGGSPFQRVSDAVAESDLSAAALEAHYARQLEAAGWQRTAGGASGPLAWSIWVVPEEDADPAGRGVILAPGEREGFLAVLEGPGPTRRSLHVQVTSAGPAGGPGFGGFATAVAVPVGPPPVAVPVGPPPPR